MTDENIIENLLPPDLPRQASFFKHRIPKDFLINLLEKVAIPEKSFYVINYISFKKLYVYDIKNKFCDIVKPFLRFHTRIYARKYDFSYYRFTVILRNMCIIHNIKFTFMFQNYYRGEVYSVFKVEYAPPPSIARPTFILTKGMYEEDEFDYYEIEN